MFSFLTGSTSTTVPTSRLLSRVEHSSVVDERVDALRQLNEIPLHTLTKHRAAQHLARVLVNTAEHHLDDADVHIEIIQTLTLLTTTPTPGGVNDIDLQGSLRHDLR